MRRRASRKRIRWQKWNASIAYNPVYYTEEPFDFFYNETCQSGQTWTSGTGYSFNQWTGVFTVTGSQTQGWGHGASVGYSGGGSGIEKIELQANTNINYYIKGADGPFGGGAYFTKGSTNLGTVFTKGSARPDADKGYSYQGTLSDGGYTYTVMSYGGNYYCYR